MLTAFAFLIHGYHPYSEDAEIYLPGVLKILNPSLFPVNAEFFGQHAGHTLYPDLIVSFVRISHLPLPRVALLLHLLSIFLLLVATWRLAACFFEDDRAKWASAALMAALLTLPIAGTALYIMDQFLNPRNLAAFAGLFAVAETLHRKWGRVILWLAFAAAVHPLMASFAILFCGWLVVLDRFRPRILGFAGRLAAILPFGITLAPPPDAYHQVALLQRSHFVLRWTWYEWLGVLGPIVIFWWLANWASRRQLKNLELVSRAMISFVLVASAAAIGLGSSPRFEALARLQPLRCMALCYMVLIVIAGGLIEAYVLKRQVWRWVVLFVPISLGMYLGQRQVFPASQHIEWPWTQPRNSWAQAFDWIRVNTPVDALFVLNPNHMNLAGEDENGFRARAERSMLADLVKDRGAASMFPPLSVKWAEQVADENNWPNFSKKDYERLRERYGISWAVIEHPASGRDHSPGMECPYENSVVRVCRLD